MKLSTVRSIVEQVFTEMGGFDAFMQWAQANPTRFYAMWSKLMPHEDRVVAPGHARKLDELKDWELHQIVQSGTETNAQLLAIAESGRNGHPDPDKRAH